MVADLFALGVTLFIMHTGTCPFKKALVDDPIYSYIATDDIKGFWSIHERIHAAKIEDGRATQDNLLFTDSFKDLMTGMFAYQPYKRPSLADVVFHPWLTEKTMIS